MTALTKKPSAVAAVVRRLPRSSNVLLILACLLYIVSPIDLIPDFIPAVGWADDTAVAWFAWQNVKALWRTT